MFQYTHIQIVLNHFSVFKKNFPSKSIEWSIAKSWTISLSRVKCYLISNTYILFSNDWFRSEIMERNAAKSLVKILTSLNSFFEVFHLRVSFHNYIVSPFPPHLYLWRNIIGSTEYSWNVRKRMKIFGDNWKFMATFENLLLRKLSSKFISFSSQIVGIYHLMPIKKCEKQKLSLIELLMTRKPPKSITTTKKSYIVRPLLFHVKSILRIRFLQIPGKNDRLCIRQRNK